MVTRSINKLSARTVDVLDAPGRYSDGGNLFLVVSPRGAKKWTFLFRWQGKLTEMGMGAASRGAVTLASARKLAEVARTKLQEGVNPLADKHAKATALKLAKDQAKAQEVTFGAYAASLVDAIEGGFRNDKHKAQWRSTLATYCKPIWKTPLPQVDTQGVLKCLTPIWQTKPETASRVRGRIERVIDGAKANGLYQGENPARWRGHLSATLPKPRKLTLGHHAALAYDAMPEFMADLRSRVAVAALCLEFTILTAARSGEALGAMWAEIDLERGVWTVPAARMKAAKEHRVPLSGKALAILTTMEGMREGDYVFAGQKPNKPLSGMAMAMMLRRMGCDDITVHGFRSAFSDWASEVSAFSAETREACLAHVVANKAEAAYRRGDQFEKRRLMMEAWAGWCEAKAGNVVQLARA